jgi:hypothetical protein
MKGCQALPLDSNLDGENIKIANLHYERMISKLTMTGAVFFQ